jgi:hypothetical protein
MEILKTTLIAVLIWGVAIWFARFMKRKSKEQAKKFEARMPEMEPVTEEERRYICKMLVDYTPAKNVVLWILFCFNLFIVIALGCATIRVGISGDDGAFLDDIFLLSVFIIITYIVHIMRLFNIECKQQYEQGELKKSIVKVQRCGSHSQGNAGSYGIIEERDTGKTVYVSLRGDESKIYRYQNMAMLVEREDMEFYLIPTMEAERESNQETNSDS